jgi:hypothetical protein
VLASGPGARLQGGAEQGQHPVEEDRHVGGGGPVAGHLLARQAHEQQQHQGKSRGGPRGEGGDRDPVPDVVPDPAGRSGEPWEVRPGRVGEDTSGEAGRPGSRPSGKQESHGVDLAERTGAAGLCWPGDRFVGPGPRPLRSGEVLLAPGKVCQTGGGADVRPRPTTPAVQPVW